MYLPNGGVIPMLTDDSLGMSQSEGGGSAKVYCNTKYQFWVHEILKDPPCTSINGETNINQQITK